MGLYWPILVVVAAITSSTVGGIWDISWHMTIGRDTFWTPAHIAIYLGGTVGGLAGGWMALQMSFFASEEERAGGISLFSFRAPLGAWIAIWGALAMITAGPFDNWWHNAYGLDVKIISPPHVVLFLGSFAIHLGVWLMLLREQNRAARPGLAAWLFCYLGAIMIVETGTIHMTEFWPHRQHGAAFFVRTARGFPLPAGPHLAGGEAALGGDDCDRRLHALLSARWSGSRRSSPPRRGLARSSIRSPTWRRRRSPCG